MIRGVIVLSVVACCLAAPHRILNGTDADDGEFPFIISLQGANGLFCGGSMVSDSWILTAAHCLDGRDPEPIKIGYGSNKNPNNISIQLAEIIVHPDYSPYRMGLADLALGRLVSPIPISQKAAPVVLAKQDQPTENGTVVTVMGWGHEKPSGSKQENLKKADIFNVDLDTCRRIFSTDYAIYDSNICAGVPGGKITQCSGDSGGPLVINGTQVGIVIWSVKPCGRPEPGVYTRVASYRDWIKQTTGV